MSVFQDAVANKLTNNVSKIKLKKKCVTFFLEMLNLPQPQCRERDIMR